MGLTCVGAAGEEVSHPSARNHDLPQLIALLITLFIAQCTCGAQSLSFYETRSIRLTPERIAQVEAEPYWQRRLARQVSLTLIERVEASQPSRDPLYAAVSTWLAGAREVPAESVLVLDKPSGAGARASIRAGGQGLELDLQPFDADEIKTVDAGDSVGSTWRPSTGFRHAGFPGGVEAYCDGHAAVCAAAFASARAGRAVVISVAAAAGRATLLVEQKTEDPATMTVRFLAPTGLTPLATPPDYADKDGSDLALESDDGRPSAVVKGVSPLTKRERVAVKLAIAGYLDTGINTAHADVVLPAGPHGEDMLYTLRFADAGSVSVEALGPARTLLPDGAHRSDVRSIPGYPAGARAPELREWLRRRYPSLNVSGTTPEQIGASADRTIDRHCGTAQWFAANYGMAVLDARQGEKRLAEVHRRGSSQRTGLQDYSATELRVLEAVLQRLGQRGLEMLRGTALVRQRSAEEASPFGDPTQRVIIAGHTFTQRSGQGEQKSVASVPATVVIYDAAHSPNRFVGGRAPDGVVRAYPPVAQVMAHELAHVIERRAPVQRQFDALIAATGAAPFTRYAAANPETEFLPEAFALYLLDPAWVKDNYPQLFSRTQAYLRNPRPSGF
jgi:hypothetical protein